MFPQKIFCFAILRLKHDQLQTEYEACLPAIAEAKLKYTICQYFRVVLAGISVYPMLSSTVMRQHVEQFVFGALLHSCLFATVSMENCNN